MKRLSIFSRLGPLSPILFFILVQLVILSLSRVLLAYTYWERISDTEGLNTLWPMGVRMDLIIISYFSILPALLLFVLKKETILKHKKSFIAFFSVFVCVVLYMEVATFPFIEEYDLRPDRKFFEYLNHPREVFGMLFEAYKLELFLGCVALALGSWFAIKTFSYLLTNYQEWSGKKKIIVFPIVALALFFAARSSMAPRPANISTASFSTNRFLNELALNSTYTLLYSGYRILRHENDPSKIYGKMENEEVFSRVKSKLTIPEDTYLKSAVPFMHSQESPFKLKRPMNIVVFLQESMGSVDVGCLRGPDTTPKLCKLKDEGLWLSNLQATGTRTVRGIEATISGFLPTPGRGVVKLDLAKKNFFTISSLLKKHGYTTNFIYGGMSNFDEMRAFFLGNGVDEIYDEPTFKNPVFRGNWGVSDEDLVRRANEVYKSYGDKPFFSVMLSTSNHSPYEFPDGRIELYEQPKQTHLNAIKYADYAIGLFFELAKKEKYFDNTLFLIVGDHNSHVKGADLVPVSKFQVPALIIGPNVPKKEINLLASQVDLMPTMLHFSGLSTEHPMIGRNLMELGEGTPGRAYMQYANNNAYRVEDQVVIMRPKSEPKQFVYKDLQLTPVDLDEDFAKEALAFSQLPWILYSKQLYH